MEAAKELLKKMADQSLKCATVQRERAGEYRNYAKECDDAADKCDLEAKQYLAAAESLV